MRKNMISLCALLLIGAASMMTAGAQNSGKPTLAVFVVGMSDANLGNSLTTELGTKFTSGGRYTLTSVNITAKRDELRATYASGGGSSIDRNALAEWGRKNSISAICLVVDDVKGIDNLFSAQLIDTKDSKLDGKGSYVRTSVAAGDVTRVALALSKQLEGPGRVARAAVTSQQLWFEPEMVFVEGGTTTLGWHADIDADRTDGSKLGPDGTNNNIPDKYTASVPSFRIGKYTVTQAQWRAVMAGTRFENIFWYGGSRGVVNGDLNSANCGDVPCDDQRPMEYVTWYLTVAFCNKLSQLAGLTEAYAIGNDKDLIDNIADNGDCSGCTITVNASATGYRLPTENEWEYAARGCKAGSCESFKYSGSNNLGEVAWHGISNMVSFANNTTHPVGQLKPNRLGIYDMTGNVWEFCWEVFGSSGHVARGSHYYNTAANGWYRVPVRFNFSPFTHRHAAFGFRVVLPAQ